MMKKAIRSAKIDNYYLMRAFRRFERYLMFNNTSFRSLLQNP